MNKENECRVSFAIHDLNPWGGQDRSTLEIAKRVSHAMPVDLYSFTFAGINTKEWGTVRLHKLWPNIPRPVVIKYNLYYLLTWLPFFRRHGLVHTTGTCSLIADIVQVQFVQKSWELRKSDLAEKGPSGIKKIYHWLLSKYKVWLEDLIYTKDKFYIAISESIKQELMSHFQIPEKQIFIVYHGVDATEFCPFEQNDQRRKKRDEIRSAYGINADEFVFILVGALNERKGVRETIEAFSLLPAALQAKAIFMVVGGGDRALYEKLAQDRGLSKRVKIVGHQKEVNYFYSAADAFILPSHYEPFGLVILEAMACGLPTIVSKTAGASELIVDGVSGLLIHNPQDTQEIAGYLIKVLQSEELSRNLGRSARAVAEQHTWKKVGGRYVEVIRKRWMK